MSLLIGQKTYPELKELENNTYDLKELKVYFTRLAQKKGGVYAYEILKQADIPPNTDLHLLGHAIGEELYKQQGITGMQYCTQDFRNACSHTIVVGMLLEYGENIFDQIEVACKKAPGGYGAYNLCYHGLGHGVLAYENFDFEKAMKLCKKTQQYGTKTAYSECIGGATMEIVGGGDHDKKTWTKQSKKYLSDPNPLSLCQRESVEGKYFCYMYLTPHLFTKAGFNPSDTYDEQAFEKAFTFCESIPKKEIHAREACFGGFGKEFVVLARQRDIRNLETMTEQQLETVHRWCSLAPHQEAKQECINASITSLLWGGENKPTAAVKFCAIIDNNKEQKACFTHLFFLMKHYIKNSAYQKEICSLVPITYKNTCIKNET